MAWKSGVRLRSRTGCISSTSLSKGRSWSAYASSAVSRTRASRSRKAGSPERSPRSASVLMKTPISPSSSCRDRPATKRRAQPVGKSVADVLGADQVKFARFASRRGGKGRKVDLVDIVAVVIHAPLISEAAAIVQ